MFTDNYSIQSNKAQHVVICVWNESCIYNATKSYTTKSLFSGWLLVLFINVSLCRHACIKLWYHIWSMSDHMTTYCEYMPIYFEIPIGIQRQIWKPIPISTDVWRMRIVLGQAQIGWDLSRAFTSESWKQGPVSISEKTSFRKISWSLEATRLVL